MNWENRKWNADLTQIRRICAVKEKAHGDSSVGKMHKDFEPGV